MIITLTGENTFAIAAALRQLVAAYMQKHSANGVERIDAEDLTPARLPDLLQGATLFAPARLVVLTNLAGNKVLFEQLTEGLAHTAPDTTVVIADSALDKRTKLYKFLQKNSTFKDFSVPGEPQLISWVQGEVARLGGAVSAVDARFLVARAGHDQWRLANEIEKLVAYAPQITHANIEQLVDPTPEGSAFELLDAALSGNHAKTAQLITTLKTQEDPYKLFGLLAAQVHAIAVAATAGGRSADAIAKDAGIHPFVVRKIQPIAKRQGLGHVQRMAADVARCDMQLKSTGADPWDILQLCLQRIAA